MSQTYQVAGRVVSLSITVVTRYLGIDVTVGSHDASQHVWLNTDSLYVEGRLSSEEDVIRWLRAARFFPNVRLTWEENSYLGLVKAEFQEEKF